MKLFFPQVDDLATEQLTDAPNPKVMRRRMYVGGVISKHRRMFAQHHEHAQLPPAFQVYNFLNCVFLTFEVFICS